MYKRITHHITEEHFTHPMAAEIAHVVHHGKPLPHAKLGSNLQDIALQLRCETAWTKFLWCMHYYISSIVDNSSNQTELGARVVKEIGYIGDIVKDYWDVATATAFNSALTAVANAECQVVKDLVAGTDATADKTALATAITAFATLISGLNSTTWHADTVNKIWTTLSTAWTDQASCRINKLWSNEIGASQWAHAILIGGTADGTPGFADIFAEGIEYLFPNGPTV